MLLSKRDFNRINLGKVKQWQVRLNTYVGMINFLLLFYLFIVENEWFPWYVWFFIIVVATVVILFVDLFYIMPQQLEYTFVKNPEWVKMRRTQKRICESLGVEYE